MARHVGDALLAPHRSYLKVVQPLLEKGYAKGLAHITGGGITENLPRILPDGCAAEIDGRTWTVPPIFQLLQERGGIPRDEMLRAFNMGVGLIVACSPRDAERVLSTVSDAGEPDASRIGFVVPGKGGVRSLCVKRLAVLISGRGSNLQSIVDAVAAKRLDATVAVVFSNRRAAPGLLRARDAGIETVCLSHRDYAERDGYDQAIVDILRSRQVDLVCLAGFMRLIGRPLLEAFPHRILNIHPSLLPAFPGLEAQRQALEHGVRVAGATVHLVTAELDGGPIVLQATVPVLDDDTVDTLSARILAEEHRLYPEAIKIVLEGRWRVEGRRFVRLSS